MPEHFTPELAGSLPNTFVYQAEQKSDLGDGVARRIDHIGTVPKVVEGLEQFHHFRAYRAIHLMLGAQLRRNQPRDLVFGKAAAHVRRSFIMREVFFNLVVYVRRGEEGLFGGVTDVAGLRLDAPATDEIVEITFKRGIAEADKDQTMHAVHSLVRPSD